MGTLVSRPSEVWACPVWAALLTDGLVRSQAGIFSAPVGGYLLSVCPGMVMIVPSSFLNFLCLRLLEPSGLGRIKELGGRWGRNNQGDWEGVYTVTRVLSPSIGQQDGPLG